MILAFRGVSPRIHTTAYIAESAQVIGHVEIAEESSVWFGAVIRGDVNTIRIGRHTNIQDNVVFHVFRDRFAIEMGDHVTVGHGVRLHGATIGSYCLIGIGAIVLDGVVMEEESMVAAGAVVTPGTRIPRRSLMMGAPARVARTLTEDDLDLIRRSAQAYVRLKGEYQES